MPLRLFSDPGPVTGAATAHVGPPPADGAGGLRAAARRALQGELDRLAAELLEAEGPSALRADELFEGGIPRVRPLLVLLAARAATGRESEGSMVGARDVMAIADLLEASVAFHDAALGRRDGRRRRAARRVLRGATHWLGTSPLAARALERARMAPAPDVLNEALDALRELGDGQALAEAMRARRPTPSDVLVHHEAHAGTVFQFACRAGGRLAGAPRTTLTGLGRYGRNVGVAWQLADDLAAFERPGLLARRAAHARPSFPVAWASDVDPDVDMLWRALSARDDAPLAADLCARVRRAGGLGAGREALVSRTWSARQALATLPSTPARDTLDRLAQGLAHAA